MLLPVRQYRCHPPDRGEYVESAFGYVERTLEVDPAHTALITVDLWNTGWEAEPLAPEYGRFAEYSFVGLGAAAAAEARRRTEENLAPALHAARRAGLTVIHSNAEAIVRRHPECAYLVEGPAAPEPPPDWPPAEVGEAALRDYHRFGYGEGAEAMWARVLERVDFPAPVRPVPGDYCVCQQAALDELLKQRRITTVIHAGFLLGHCLLDSVGGVRKLAFLWRRPGYRDLVLRDCTVAQEYHWSVDGFRATETFITWLEATGIPTLTAADLIAACPADTAAERNTP
jgi:nicotinamidase-related amidase